MNLLRFLLAIIVGCIALGATVFVVQAIGHALYPPSPEFTATVDQLMAAYQSGEAQRIEVARSQAASAVAALPIGAVLMVVLAWVTGAFVAGGLAAIMAPYGRMVAALVVTSLDVLAIIANLALIPHPSWVGPVAFACCGVAGLSVGLCVRNWRASRATRQSRASGAAPGGNLTAKGA